MSPRPLPLLMALFMLIAFAALPLAACGDDDDDDDDIADDDTSDDDTSDDDTADDDTDDDTDDDDTGDDDDTAVAMLPGPGQDGYDADLEAKARRIDRQFHNFAAYAIDGIATDAVVEAEDTEDRELIEAFLRDSDEWSFQKYTADLGLNGGAGLDAFDVVDGWEKVAGMYGGVGVAADAYRYAVMKEQGYPQADIDQARDYVEEGLDGLIAIHDITGVEGIIARGYARLDAPGSSAYYATKVTPLFDEHGDPLPPEKGNGSWRADNSTDGAYPNFIWEDSCSRDMFIGWAAGFAAIWEVIRDDPAFSQAKKDHLQEIAKWVVEQLSIVRDSGYDLEIWDADGRQTYHGFLNEHSVDRLYIPGDFLRNGLISGMAIGSVSAFAYVAEDEEVDAYLYDTLIEQRQLHEHFRANMLGYNVGYVTNFSAVNMAYMGAWLTVRYNKDPEVIQAMQYSIDHFLWNLDDSKWFDPRDVNDSLFSYYTAGGLAGSSAFHGADQPFDTAIVDPGTDTLRGYPDAPYWDFAVFNCDESEIESGHCVGNDGVTEWEVLGEISRNGELIVDKPVPMALRPPSNYHWRSDPYAPNGDGNVSNDGSGMNSAVDFRYAYWLGRYVK
ncbi:hypothetical protein KDL45_00255 [bacterium]|nr:hypothetical protein [bacterium]